MLIRNQYPKILLLLSIILFLIACTQKTYCTNHNCGENWSGLAILISGLIGFMNGGACLIWLANPLILCSWIAFKNTKISLICGLMALTLGISFLFFDEIIINEAGHYGEITGYETGYYLWNFSFVTIVIANLINIKNKNTVARYT